MLAVDLDPAIELRLEELAKRTGHTKSFCVQEAILEHLEDREDTWLATQRLLNPAPTLSAEEVRRELAL